MPKLAEWIKTKEDYNKQWNQLSSSIKGSAIDPISLDCSLTADEIVKKAVSYMEGMHPVVPSTWSNQNTQVSAMYHFCVLIYHIS